MNILYIDDDAGNRAVVRDMLRLGGVDLDEAADARSGLALFEQRRYDLVLMDLRMPDLNGITAMRLLRARDDRKADTPIVIVTADLTAGGRAMCRDAGATDFLAKPIDMDCLFATIASIAVKSTSLQLI